MTNKGMLLITAGVFLLVTPSGQAKQMNGWLNRQRFCQPWWMNGGGVNGESGTTPGFNTNSQRRIISYPNYLRGRPAYTPDWDRTNLCGEFQQIKRLKYGLGLLGCSRMNIYRLNIMLFVQVQ